MSDGLKKLGKYVATTRKKTNHVQKNYSQNFPIIERAQDRLGYFGNQSFEMFFELPHKDNEVIVDIFFRRRFDVE